MNLFQIYKSAMKSNLTDKIVLVQNGIDEVRRNATTGVQQNNNALSIFNFISNFGTTNQIKSSHSYLAESVLLSDLVDSVIKQEHPKKLVINMDIDGYECKALLGKMLRTN